MASWAPRFPFHGLWAGRFQGLWAGSLQRTLSLAGRLVNMSATRKACRLYLQSTHRALLCVRSCFESNNSSELGSLSSVCQLSRKAFRGLQPVPIKFRIPRLPFLPVRLCAACPGPVLPRPPSAHFSPPVWAFLLRPSSSRKSSVATLACHGLSLSWDPIVLLPSMVRQSVITHRQAPARHHPCAGHLETNGLGELSPWRRECR